MAQDRDIYSPITKTYSLKDLQQVKDSLHTMQRLITSLNLTQRNRL